MTLADNYKISVRHQRSTRIDSDLSQDFFEGLVYHGTAQHTLETLSRQYAQAGQRAFTLTGAYGSGKSTIALLLLGLLNNDQGLREAACSVLNKQSQQLIDDSFGYQKGWLQIRAVGGVSDPIDMFWKATLQALKDHPNTQVFAERYADIPTNEAELIARWEMLFNAVGDHIDGVLLLADEMGKTLEFINKHKKELHLFQDLAEVLGRLKTPVIFLGLLHQSFSEYAKERGTKLQEEWGKIQGRYSDIHYNVSTDETVALIAKSIIANTDIESDTSAVDITLQALHGSDERKQLLQERLQQCAPLHPMTALLLGPLAKRRFSQNERSTFSFLNSREPYSFQQFLENTHDIHARYTAAHLWDYLETNLEHTILSSPDGHAWAGASEVIRHTDAEPKAIELLKAIALINMFGKPAQLFATTEILQAVTGIDDSKEIDRHLDTLKKASRIIYRNHLSTWIVFEGSDLDIPKLLEEKIAQLDNSNEAINYLAYSQQTIAKSHYHRKGVMRWVEQSLMANLQDLDTENLIASRKGEFANFILLINEAPTEELIATTKQVGSLALANAINATDIATYAKEVYALDLLKADKEFGDALPRDKVAQKEYTSRLAEAQKMLWNSLEEGFVHSEWILQGTKRENQTLSQLAGDLADMVYKKTPKILNELVNRNKLSGTAVSARKKLLEAMLDNEHLENLGIHGFPPEMAMYISCLKNTRLHTKIDDQWQFSMEHVTDIGLKSLFAAADEHLQDNAGKLLTFASFETLWQNGEWGITQGVSPLLLLAYLKTKGQTIAFYEKDMSGQFAFIAEPDVDYVHAMQKNSQDLAVKYVVLNAEEARWLDFLASLADNYTNGQGTTNNLLGIATPLVTRIHSLPNWVRHASQLASDAQLNKQVLAVRDAFLRANDPYTLLITELPKLLNPVGDLDTARCVDALEVCFDALTKADPAMKAQVESHLRALLPASKDTVAIMCDDVEKLAGDLRLRAFARDLRKGMAKDNAHSNWLESLMAVVIGRGAQNWNEGNIRSVQQKMSEHVQKFLTTAKSAASSSAESRQDTEMKTISLVLEDDNGKLLSYQKEIYPGDTEKLSAAFDNVNTQLAQLNEFERIDVLQQLLKQALAPQG